MNILILGLGAIGQRYVRIIKKLLPNANIAALRYIGHNTYIEDSLSAFGVGSLAQSLNIQSFSTKHQALAFKPEYIIDTRPPLHHLRGLEPFIKTVNRIYCEKPLCISFDDVHINPSSPFFEHRHKIAVGYHLIQHPLVSLLQARLNLADVVRYSFIYEESLRHIQPFRHYSTMHEAYIASSGSVTHSLSHAIHLPLYLLSETKPIVRSCVKLSPEYLGLDINACCDTYLDHSTACGEFTGFIRCAFDAHKPQQTLSFLTKEHQYVLSLHENTLETWNGHRLCDTLTSPIDKIQMLTLQMCSFLNLDSPFASLTPKPLVTFDQALETLAICESSL